MFIVEALNLTGTKKDGTSDYNVVVRINEKIICEFFLKGHIRKEGGVLLLRKIADQWENELRHADDKLPSK